MIVTAMYEVGSGQKFDLDYYLKTHMKLVRDRFGPMGMTSSQVMHGVGTPTGAAAPYHIITAMEFTSMEAFGAAIKTHGREVMGDVANFTDTQPNMQFNEVIG